MAIALVLSPTTSTVRAPCWTSWRTSSSSAAFAHTLDAYRSDLLQFGGYLKRTHAPRSPLGPRRRSSPPRRRRGEDAGGRGGDAAAQGRLPALATATCAGRAYDADPTANLRAPSRAASCRRCSGATRSPGCSSAARHRAGALRDRALLELMYACGLRASEAIELEIGDVDLETGVLRARGKGSKERLVPIGSAATRAVSLPARPARLAGDRLEAACSSTTAAPA